MHFKKRMFCIIAVLLTLLIDTSITPFTGLSTSYCPRLCLVTVVIIGTLCGKTQGIIYGTFAGLMLGYTIYTPAAYTMAIYTGCGLLSGLLGKHCGRYLVTSFPVFSSVLLYELFYCIYFAINGGTITGGHLSAALIRMAGCILISQPMYFLYSKVLSPKPSNNKRRLKNEAY